MTECLWEEILWGELFGAVHFRVLNTALQMNYQHNSTCRLLRDWRHGCITSSSCCCDKILTKATEGGSICFWLMVWEHSLSCEEGRMRRMAAWGTWWSQCVLRHKAERGVQLAFSFWAFKKYFKFCLFIYLFIVHLSGCAHMHSGTTVCMWSSEDDNMLELALSFHVVGPQNWTRVLRHSNK